MRPAKLHHQVVRDLFLDHFKDHLDLRGIEIGTGAGDLTVTLLRDMPKISRLYTIDPWKHVDGREFEAGDPQERHDAAQKAARQRLDEFGDRVVIMPMTSKEALPHIPEFVDFVWIDGDHSGETVEFDCDAYLPLVKPGGILGGHDYGQVHPLTEIIMKKFNSCLNSGNDFTWWVFV